MESWTLDAGRWTQEQLEEVVNSKEMDHAIDIAIAIAIVRYTSSHSSLHQYFQTQTYLVVCGSTCRFVTEWFVVVCEQSMAVFSFGFPLNPFYFVSRTILSSHSLSSTFKFIHSLILMFFCLDFDLLLFIVASLIAQVCKFFIEAVKARKYGCFWKCPNGETVRHIFVHFISS